MNGQTKAPEKDGIDGRPRLAQALIVALTWSTAHFCRFFGSPRTSGAAKPSKAEIVDRIDRDELALQMRGKLGDLDAGVGADALDLVAIGLAGRRFLDVDQPAVPARNLDALVAEAGRPFGHSGERVERRLIAGELGEKDRRSLHRFHVDFLPFISRRRPLFVVPAQAGTR